jgi:hypothetical protein
MIGALVFLGCPWRAMLRLAGGDGNAIFGLLGLIGGIWIGTLFAFLKRRKESSPAGKKSDRGFLVFANTSEVIRAENLLKAQGWKIRVMGPPPEIRSGCDLEGAPGFHSAK